MKPLNDFLSRILPHVQGCSEPLAREHLLDTCIDFCTRTQVIVRTLLPVDVEEGVHEYNVAAAQQQVVVAPVKVWFKGRELSIADQTTANAASGFYETLEGVDPTLGEPRVYYFIEPGLIGLWPRPDADASEALSARAALAPSRSATQVDNELYDKWMTVIVSGTLDRLKSIPGQVFSRDSSRDAIIYAMGLTRAMASARKGQTNANLRVQPVSFTNTRK